MRHVNRPDPDPNATEPNARSVVTAFRLRSPTDGCTKMIDIGLLSGPGLYALSDAPMFRAFLCKEHREVPTGMDAA